uniref:Uncharacterized protein n=1 Tax=Anopheles dirus TaxID=7168 RepID=A0A182NVW1_9DIPT
ESRTVLAEFIAVLWLFIGIDGHMGNRVLAHTVEERA